MQGLSLQQRFFKRTFDLFFALFILVFFGWLIVLAWVAASIDTRSNGMFSQTRIGRWGVPFTIYKIKTMRQVKGITTTITTKHDARITFLGKLLRRSKIDELPQFFNVLLGDMSLVGPRPDVPGFADHLTGEDRAILCLRPGITGPATLAFRNEEEVLAGTADPISYNRDFIYPTKVVLNLNYLKTYRLRNDLWWVIATLLGRRNLLDRDM